MLFVDQLLHKRQEPLAVLRQSNAAFASVKQRAAGLPLHGGNGVADAGLGVAQHIRSQRDIAELRNLQEYFISDL